MRGWYGMAAIVAGLLVWTHASSEAEVDLSKVLPGRWEGDVQMAAGTYPRTLIIKSIQTASGNPVVEAEYGGKGNSYGGLEPRLAPVDVMSESFGNDVILRFYTAEGWRVELTLSRDQKHFYGDLRISINRAGGAWAINPVRLTKVE